MYKNAGFIALISGLLAVLFLFAAFKGYHFWYEGFVFFFWLALALLNYRHRTSLWLLRNRTHAFLRFYLAIFVVGFLADYVIGQQIAHLWSYPYYATVFDWVRLYALIYPFGGLSILELMFLIGSTLHERFVYLPRVHRAARIDLLDTTVDVCLGIILIGSPLLYAIGIQLPYAITIVYAFLLWAVLTTIKLEQHLKHGLGWVAILLAVLVTSVLLHEVPNTAVFEWQYHSAPILNMSLIGIPLWVVVGWYMMILVMVRLWIRLILPRQ